MALPIFEADDTVPTPVLSALGADGAGRRLRSTMAGEDASPHRDPRTTLERVARLIPRLLCVSAGCVTTAQPQSQHLVASAGSGDWLDVEHGSGLSDLCSTVIHSGHPLGISDARAHPTLRNDPAVTAGGLVSVLCVPVRTSIGDVVGSVCAMHGSLRMWSAEDLEALGDVAAGIAAELVGQASSRTRSGAEVAYHDLLDRTTEMVCTADASGVITYVNDAWCRAFGFTRHDACGMRSIDLVTSEHRAAFADAGRRLNTGERIDGLEVVAIGAGGRRIVCRGGATPIMVVRENGGAQCIGSQGVYQDVTVQRRLDASRARLVATLEATSDFVGIASAEGRIEYINRSGRRLLGLSDEEDVGALTAESFHPASTLTLLASEGFPSAIRDGEWRGEGDLQHRDGSCVPVAITMTAHPALSASEPGFFSAMMRDLRMERAARAALTQSEAQLRAMFANTAVGVSLIGIDGMILRTNAAFDTMLGHETGSLAGRFAPDLSPAAEASVTRAAVRALRAGEIESVSVEKRFFHAKGDIRVLALSLSLVPLEDGTSAVLGLASDVTDRVRAEQALVKEREFLTATLESLSDGVVACDERGTLVLFNSATRTLHGADQLPLAPEQWAGTYDLFRVDGRTPMPKEEIPLFRALVDGEVKGAEMVIAPRDGERRTVVTSGKALLGPDGRVQGAVVAMRDVTAEREAERALRESEERYRRLMDLLPDGVIQHVGGRILFVNAAMARIVGVEDPSDMVGRSVHELLATGDVAASVARAEAALDAADGGVSWREEAVRRSDGTTVPCEIVGTRIDVHGAPGVLSVVRDVSARLQHESALREREVQLATMYNHSSDLMMLLRVERDARGGICEYRCESVNQPLLAMTGRGMDAYVGRTLREIDEPNRYAMSRARCDDAVRTGQKQQFEFVTRGVNGHMTFESTLTPIRDGSGRCTHLLGANRDVTARRDAEAALQRSELAFRTMLQTVRSVAVTLDSDARVTFANEALISLTGWTQTEVIGAEWFPKFTAEPTMMRMLFDCVIAGKELVPHYENELVTRDGARRLIVWDNTLLRNADGEIVGTASIGQDVTDQRALQARLAALSEQDELTGLLNRRGFSKRVAQGLRQVRRSGRYDALLYLDLDRFKPINDTYGHAAGDQALRDLSDVLQETIRDTDVAGRVGGDEFAIYASHLETAEAGAILVRRLQDAIARHNAEETRNGRPYELAFSAGLALVRPDDTEETLFARADAALYTLKKARTCATSA